MSESTPAFALPPRYEAVSRLGRGGGGEVWAVRDVGTGVIVALKVLAEDAGQAETMALVREAIVLSGLEGLGVPRVLAFGSLQESGRRYLVRELVAGHSLAEGIDERRGAWLEPIANAADQLTVLHRAGLLHGDIKPANIIVGEDGAGTLVDLGLSAPWLEGGARAHGLTPQFAAPELLYGSPLTVRAEVYALGATLEFALRARGDEVDETRRGHLAKIAARATSQDPLARHPSVDEFASALRSGGGLAMRGSPLQRAWPILDDGHAEPLVAVAAALAPGDALAIVGKKRSGRTTLLRRLSWSLGVAKTNVANIEIGEGRLTTAEIIAREVEAAASAGAVGGLLFVVDDLERIDPTAHRELLAASSRGARIVAVGPRDVVATVAKGKVHTFEVPLLDASRARELTLRAIPSLPSKLAEHLITRVGRSPGALRTFVERLGDKAITSAEDIDAIAQDVPQGSAPPSTRPRAETSRELERMLDTGRFDEAAELLRTLEPRKSSADAPKYAIARAKIELARGEGERAMAALGSVDAQAMDDADRRSWWTTRARALTRAGDFLGARESAGKAVRTDAVADVLTADALSVEGVAAAYMGDDDHALTVLDRAVDIANHVDHARIKAIVHGSLAIIHQRAGRATHARTSYQAALGAAEAAGDAWTIATTRLNLASLAKADGDLAQALEHLEAAVDMGRRAGGHVAVQQARLNLANLDLYVGRYARTKAAIDGLAEQERALSTGSRAYLFALRAELAARVGELERAAGYYERSAEGYEAVERPLDAAEARLEGMLARLMAWEQRPLAERGPRGDGELRALERDLDALRTRLGDGGFREHDGLANLVLGALAAARGDEGAAHKTFQLAYDRAIATGQREWAWRALDARARLAIGRGAYAIAERDTATALALLEEIAVRLPRDLREVFWNDPRRRALRETHAAVHSGSASLPRVPGIASPVDALLGQALGRKTHTFGRTSLTLAAPLPAEDRLARIFEMTRDLAREHDLERLLGRVTEHAVGLLGAERGLIVLVDERGDMVTHTSRDHKGEEAAHNFSRSVAERVIREGSPVLATSARDDERLAEAVSVHQLMIQSVACVPIRGAPPAGTTIGALYVETRLRPGVRFQEELATLSAFADQAAIAIEGARLLAENKRRADELALANAELSSAKDKLAEVLGRRTEQLHTARRDLKQARAELHGHFGYKGLVGTSSAMRKLYALIERIKDTTVPVLVTGESGTGKEVIAKAIHAAGPRGKQPFLGINCGAIPANLLESELFGHVRGAFTGADRDRKGMFQQANLGTLLLDEIGEMPLAMQPGLLRVLQERTVRPVGGTTEQPCDVRIIAATNRDLDAMVSAGTFREDLFYRLHVVELRVPPLRERVEDIPALVDHFLTLFAARHKRERKTLDRDAVRALSEFDWPGNVRQLEHVLLNAWLLADNDEIRPVDLDLPRPIALASERKPSSVTTRNRARTDKTAKASSHHGTSTRPRSADEFREREKKKILDALAKCQWNRVKAAEAVGLPRRTFYRRLKEYGIV